MSQRSTKSKGSNNETLKYVVIAFIAIYGLGQLVLLLQPSGIFGTSSPRTTSRSNNAAVSNGDGAAQELSASKVVLEADIEIPFSFDNIEELPFPEVSVDDGGISVFDVVSKDLMEAGEARQALLDARTKDEKEKGGKYDSTPVTVGLACWTDHRLLWKMGLDRLADDMEAGRIPREVRRSRTAHGHAAVVSDLMCSFHSTPIAGGLQCCCSSNTSVPYYSDKGQSPGGTFFCLPSTVIVGARNSGAGLLASFFQQHAYLEHGVAPPPNAMSGVRNPYVVDTVMGRYLHHYSSKDYLPDGFAGVDRSGRPKAVSPKFWLDASPSYLYGINVSGNGEEVEVDRCLLLTQVPTLFVCSQPSVRLVFSNTMRLQSAILLRRLLPRSKVLVVLRDPVERAYSDLVHYVLRQGRKAAETSLLTAIHTCMKAVACTEGGAASKGVAGLTADQWSAGASAGFEKCLVDRLSQDAEVSNVEGLAPVPAIVPCVGKAVRPGAPADWSYLYRQHNSAVGIDNLASCSAGGGIAAESAGVWSRLQHSFSHQVVGCLEAASQDSGLVFTPTPEALLAAAKTAAARLQQCSIPVGAGTAVPVPIDLMAANINGYDLGLFAVAGTLPADGPAGRVLIDGTSDGCFPEGVDVDDPAAPLARSLYLRPLQRLHAAYGRKTVIMAQTDTLRSDPGAILDPVFEQLSVYKPTLDPVRARTDCRAMGWVGEAAAECDVRVPTMDAAVKAVIEDALSPYSVALKAYMAAEVKE